MTKQGILFTVGGTIDPICFTLEQIRPSCAAFICSEDTKKQVADIESYAKEELRLALDRKTFIVSNPDDLTECVKTCNEALFWLKNEKALPNEAIRVDYTGGKKNMSAAAVLAATPNGLCFLYVSGESAKNGVGDVIPGKEKLVNNANPWDQLGVENIRLALRLADKGQFLAAKEVLTRQQSLFKYTTPCASENLSCAADKKITNPAHAQRNAAKRLGMLIQLLDGLAAWDAFNHANAIKRWSDGQIPQDLMIAAEHAGDRITQNAACAIKLSVPSLLEIVSSRDDAWLKKKEKIDPLLPDLIANADRRREQGDCDLAALLYYRALELNADRRLRRFFGIDNSKVSMEQIPNEQLREKWRHRFNTNNLLKCGMDSSYEILAAHNDSHGKKYCDDMDGWRKAAAMRNQSWLVHDLQPASSKGAQELRTRVMNFLCLNDSDLTKWPKLLE